MKIRVKIRPPESWSRATIEAAVERSHELQKAAIVACGGTIVSEERTPSGGYDLRYKGTADAQDRATLLVGFEGWHTVVEAWNEETQQWEANDVSTPA